MRFPCALFIMVKVQAFFVRLESVKMCCVAAITGFAFLRVRGLGNCCALFVCPEVRVNINLFNTGGTNK
jgi:hypothetical protein